MSTPLYEKLIKYHSENRISFAMPGHKNGRGLRSDLLKCDVTELRTTENLHNPRETVTESKRLLAKLYGADESFILTCGSTSGIQAMIAAAVKRGRMLLAAADCHMSVINACALLGINLKLIPRETDSEFFTAKPLFDIEKYIDGVDAVIITSPTYYGVCSDIEGIAKTCHEHGVPLLVDEAHGAHFAADSRFPAPAIACGADAVCQSAHKTLNALTGAAFLHVRGDRINRARLERAVTMIETSSPSYVIVSSADIAREEIERGGWDVIIDVCENFKEKVNLLLHIKPLKNDDPTRLVLNFSAYKITGFEVDEILSEKYGIDIEMSDLSNIVLIATPSNTAEDLERLFGALVKITSELDEREKSLEIPPFPKYDGVISPYKAFFADTLSVSLDKSIGKISAVTVTPYPPGIPVIYMGSVIGQEQAEYIKRLFDAGAEITGMDNENIEVVNEGNI